MSVTRWQPDTRVRLEHAALELFQSQGFADTTVPQIAARAGLTTRTFFRHFADKREVIFAGDEIPELARRIITEAPPTIGALELIVGAMPAVAAARFDGRRDRIRAWRSIVRSDPGLVERDLRKRADLAGAIRDGFIGRGLTIRDATLIAEATAAVMQLALDEWVDQDGDRPFTDIALECLGAMQSVLQGAAPRPGTAAGV